MFYYSMIFIIWIAVAFERDWQQYELSASWFVDWALYCPPLAVVTVVEVRVR